MDKKGLSTYLKKRKLICRKMRPLKYYLRIWDLEDKYSDPKEREEQGESSSSFSTPPSTSLSTSPSTPPSVVDLVTSNYIIMKHIMNFSHNWQQLRILSSVCKLWHDVARNLQRQMISADEFCIYSLQPSYFPSTLICDVFGGFRSEPLIAIAFLNKKAMTSRYPCNLFPSSTCDKSCKERHKMLDFIHARLCYPSNSLFGVSCDKVDYISRDNMRLRNSPTSQDVCSVLGVPFIGGISIPRIPGVRVYKLQQVVEKAIIINNAVFCHLLEAMETELVKCLLIFVSEKYSIIHGRFSSDIISCIMSRQGEDHPFALGGCTVRGTIGENFNFCTPKDPRYLTILAFTVEKGDAQHGMNFEAYSSIVATRNDDEDEIDYNMGLMASRIPKRQFSAAIKFSCVGRIDNNIRQQNNFMKHFPRTPLAGCFGMGEIGVNHPSSLEKDNKYNKPPSKKACKEVNWSERNIFYEYSTVIVMFMWGN